MHPMQLHRLHARKAELLNSRPPDRMPPDVAPSTEVFHYTHKRQVDLYQGNPRNLVANYLSRQIPGLLQEREYSLGTINKICVAQWLSDR